MKLGQIGQISLLVRDAQKAEAWYRDTLGLTHLYTFGNITFFECAGTRLFIREVPDAEWRPSSTLYFVVPEIRTSHAELVERGATFTEEPQLIHRHDSGVEEWMAFFEDPDGNALAIMASQEP